jgi:hypothetical protein
MASCSQRNAVFARQLDVDEDSIGSQLSTELQTSLTFCSRADEFDLTSIVQQSGQVLGGQRFVFNDDGTDPNPHSIKSLASRQLTGVCADRFQERVRNLEPQRNAQSHCGTLANLTSYLQLKRAPKQCFQSPA